MALPEWREEAIAKKHDRRGFDCGERALNDFLHLNARQSHERGGPKTFVAVDAGDGKTVHGYYSLVGHLKRSRLAPEFGIEKLIAESGANVEFLPSACSGGDTYQLK
jgi:hypothetical protein